MPWLDNSVHLLDRVLGQPPACQRQTLADQATLASDADWIAPSVVCTKTSPVWRRSSPNSVSRKLRTPSKESG